MNKNRLFAAKIRSVPDTPSEELRRIGPTWFEITTPIQNVLVQIDITTPTTTKTVKLEQCKSHVSNHSLRSHQQYNLSFNCIHDLLNVLFGSDFGLTNNEMLYTIH